MKKITNNVVVLDRGYYTTCTVNFHGATVVSWRIRNLEQLFVSREAVFDDKRIIRGGISFVFPRFGPWIFGPQHGFTRIMRWNLEKAPTRLPNGDVEAVLSLTDDDFSRSMWNYPFKLLYRITLLENELQFDIKVTNLGKKLPFTFNLLLHTYLRVPEIEDCKILGLRVETVEEVVPIDSTQESTILTLISTAENLQKDEILSPPQAAGSLSTVTETSLASTTISSSKTPRSSIIPVTPATTEVSNLTTTIVTTRNRSLIIDRWIEALYVDTQEEHEIQHVVNDETMIIQKRNLPDTLLWNPWSEFAKDIPNFGKDEYKRMICFKTGHLLKPVKLMPGEELEAGLVMKIKCPEIDPMYLFW